MRTNNGLSGIPLLANPSEPLTSPPIYQDKPDWNLSEDLHGARAASCWKPTEAFSAEAALLHSNSVGDGGPQVNPDFPGGKSPLDPSSTLPSGGPYQEFSQIDQPWSRYTNLSSLDMSYDAGFATVSSTSSYYTTSGSELQDNTYSLAGLDNGGYLPYYAGVPTNPRFVYDQVFADHAHTFTQEVRLVSTTGPDKLFDYVLGVFYENQTRAGDPGPSRSRNSGVPGGAGSAGPCGFRRHARRPGTWPSNRSIRRTSRTNPCSASSPGTSSRAGQVTVGARHFNQSSPTRSPTTTTRSRRACPRPARSPASKTVGKVNPSYEYAPNQYVYAVWSQGFRRGGATRCRSPARSAKVRCCRPTRRQHQ